MTYDPRAVLRGSISFVGRSTVLHVLTSFVIGALSYWLVARRYWTGPEALPWLRDLVAGISGVIEDWVYTTTFHAGLFCAHLPEVVVQTLLYGYLLLAWERRTERAQI